MQRYGHDLETPTRDNAVPHSHQQQAADITLLRPKAGVERTCTRTWKEQL